MVKTVLSLIAMLLTAFVALALIGHLGRADAAVVTSSSGVPVMSIAGPVTQGGVLVEQGESYVSTNTKAMPAEYSDVECERTVEKHRSFIGGLLSGLPQQGYSYTGHKKWTKTVTYTKTVQTKAAQPAKFGRIRGNRDNGNNGRSRGDHDNNGRAG